tara:strand:- start:199 stop:324 length:126 start_codon:yes stop_codon:yes gene_type:complete
VGWGDMGEKKRKIDGEKKNRWGEKKRKIDGEKRKEKEKRDG